MAQRPRSSSRDVGATRVTPTRGEVVDRQRQAFGGIKWGAAFFGWLSANGLAVILISLAAAAGLAVGLTAGGGSATGAAAANAPTVGLVSGIVLLVLLMLSYYCGGYVAGRMSRFDGIRQGVAVWVIGLLVTVALALAGAVLGAQYNVFSNLNLPTIPVGAQQLTTGGLIALGAVLLGTLLAAVAGGKAGEHYHRKVDKAGLGA